jgi:hypothetical protein
VFERVLFVEAGALLEVDDGVQHWFVDEEGR